MFSSQRRFTASTSFNTKTKREGLVEGPFVGTGDGLEPDEGPVDGAGMRHGPSDGISRVGQRGAG